MKGQVIKMENNANSQTQYNQPPVQQIYYQPSYGMADPNYAATVKDFLIKAIVSCAISSLPIGSIIAMIMATKNRKAILEYLDRGGMHTVRVKVCSALSRAGRYAGIAYTIFWGVYMVYFAVVIFAVIMAFINGAMYR